ncbi:hypothetical protein M378DRAFT_13827 [Amanita muscaria Koide BX008]|uniref:Uncharacterized protein n=1 Tax=Amanita muscaria (strain Koide BX008) TaxID=946122 RepID=A0A0C2SD26_AMAMK|nr:hypothetical protein M378DRAFT_13827 [Amanita muscaria Koide BX008]
MSSLLLPALGSSPLSHGDIVRYHAGSAGQQHGIIVGSTPDNEGNHNLTPFLPPKPQQKTPEYISDTVVKVHPNNVAPTRISNPKLASQIANQHKQNPPSEVTRSTFPVKGSPNAQGRGLRGSPRKTGGRM